MSSSFTLRGAVLVVAGANLAYGLVEMVMSWRIGSVSLFADSVDFFEDAAVNLLIFFALVWSAATRARVGMVLAVLVMVPALALLWTLFQKWQNPVVPAPFTLTLVGLGALIVNIGCAALLVRFRHESGSLVRAAFLSARNDALANLAIMAAGLITAFLWASIWPDIIVGLGIAWLNLDAAQQVWAAARREAAALRV